MTQAKHLFRKLQHAFGQDTLSADRALISAIQTQPRTALTTAELCDLTEQLGLPVIDKTEEQMERDWYLYRGQKLIRQESWTELSVEIQQFDEMLDQMAESMVFDGEVMSDDFQTLMREIHRKGGAKTDDAVLNLFDCIPLWAFKEGGYSASLQTRKEMMDEYQYPSNISKVEYVRMNLSDDDGQKQFADYNKLCIDKGFEGIMIKPMDGPYECKRSSLWLKVKPFIEVSLKVVDTEEGTGRNAGKLGALVVEGTDMDKFIKTNVGSGLTDADRETFWKAKDKLIGQIVEVRADAITQNQDTSNEWSLRFPRFLRFRGFEPGEKL